MQPLFHETGQHMQKGLQEERRNWEAQGKVRKNPNGQGGEQSTQEHLRMQMLILENLLQVFRLSRL